MASAYQLQEPNHPLTQKKGPKFGPCLDTLGGRDGDGMLVQKAGKIVVARTDLGAVVAAMGMGWAEDL